MEAAARDRRPAVGVTPAALEAINRLEAAHGPLAFHQSGGCCDGTSPICLKDGELPPGPHDVLLGDIGGAPFYIDADQYERWGKPSFLVDVSPGAAEGFSLEGLIGVHFVTRSAPGGPPSG
jgi:uncharacterized protein (DUF779 family)